MFISAAPPSKNLPARQRRAWTLLDSADRRVGGIGEGSRRGTRTPYGPEFVFHLAAFAPDHVLDPGRRINIWGQGLSNLLFTPEALNRDAMTPEERRIDRDRDMNLLPRRWRRERQEFPDWWEANYLALRTAGGEHAILDALLVHLFGDLAGKSPYDPEYRKVNTLIRALSGVPASDYPGKYLPPHRQEVTAGLAHAYAVQRSRDQLGAQVRDAWDRSQELDTGDRDTYRVEYVFAPLIDLEPGKVT